MLENTTRLAFVNEHSSYFLMLCNRYWCDARI